MTLQYLLAIVLLAGCSGSESSTPDGGSSDANGAGSAECAPTCLEQRWWVNVGSSDCSVFCMGSASAPECSASDCEQVSVQRYDAGTLRVIAPLLFSASHRSYYLLGGQTSNTYALMSDCQLQVDSHTPEMFTCSGSMLSFPVGQFTAATNEQAVALDAAGSANAPGEYPY